MSTSVDDDEIEQVVIPAPSSFLSESTSTITDEHHATDSSPLTPGEGQIVTPLTNDLFYKNFKIEHMKVDESKLPLAYWNPETDGKVTWNCSYDHAGKITSVFAFLGGLSNGEKDKRCAYLANEEEAFRIRDELKANGWKASEPPKIKTKIPGEEKERPLNRKESRFLQRKIAREMKKVTYQ